MEVRGRDLIAGLPRTIPITSSEVMEAIELPLQQIVAAVRHVLEQTPPELSSDIIDKGMVMSGGGALLRNIDKLLTQVTGVPCHVAENALNCVALGHRPGARALRLLQEVARPEHLMRGLPSERTASRPDRDVPRRRSSDLHCHTSASFDSLATPGAVVRAAAARGLTHLAITDHDRIDGALEAQARAAREAPRPRRHRRPGDPHVGRRPDRAVPGRADPARAVAGRGDRRGARAGRAGRHARTRSTASAAPSGAATRPRSRRSPGWSTGSRPGTLDC